MQTPPDVLTVDEVCDFLKISKSNVYRLLKQGIIPSFRIGRSIRVSRVQIEKLLA